jgi:ribonucleoside-triphosphate reductase (thioredoxin)
MTSPFRLDPAFVARYAQKEPPFGFDKLGELVYLRTYSRIKDDGSKEQWYETVERVVNGCYNMQKRHIETYSLGWSDADGQKSGQEMYERIYNMKFLPAGRSLWAMGSAVTEERGLYAALFNCAFVSTERLDVDLAKPFCFLFDLAMCGTGVGYDVKGSGRLVIQKPDMTGRDYYTIPDTREGWVQALRNLLNSYFITGYNEQYFDYSQVRPAGAPIRGFGGQASGAEPLKKMLETVRSILDKETGRPISITTIADIMNLIGICVVAGNVRRSAEICFGDYNSEEFVNLKNYAMNPQREGHGWASNNSILADIGMDYSKVTKQIQVNGEPGLVWLDNMREFSRMNGTADYKDRRVMGANPCSEQSLESYELCNLVETFPNRATDREDFMRTLKFAYLFGKTVTLAKTHWPESNKVALRNRRIGCSMSGIAQFITRYGVEELRQWCEEGYGVISRYDDVYSDWLAIPKSIKYTSIKPSGTVSLLAGATPGMHYPDSRFYIRRMRLSEDSSLLVGLREAGYRIEQDTYSPRTMVVEIPIDVGEGIRTGKEISMWEQLSLAAFLQRHWADNQVSCTITFDPVTEGPQIEAALNYFQYHTKSVSFLPRLAQGAYKQMPYETITEERYLELSRDLKKTKLVERVDAESERGCDGVSCSLVR